MNEKSVTKILILFSSLCLANIIPTKNKDVREIKAIPVVSEIFSNLTKCKILFDAKKNMNTLRESYTTCVSFSRVSLLIK
jgi:hypothetical protein